MRINIKHLASIVGGIGLLAGCSEELPARTTKEFVNNPIMLEAAIVRCSKDRAASRYEAECVNARQAVRHIEVKEEAARRAEFEARSTSKRQALRRAQQAAAQARRKAAEMQRLREEAEYLAQFGVVSESEAQVTPQAGDDENTPPTQGPENDLSQGLLPATNDGVPAGDGENTAIVTVVPEDSEPTSTLESVRDELQRRNVSGESQ